MTTQILKLSRMNDKIMTTKSFFPLSSWHFFLCLYIKVHEHYELHIINY